MSGWKLHNYRSKDKRCNNNASETLHAVNECNEAHLVVIKQPSPSHLPLCHWIVTQLLSCGPSGSFLQSKCYCVLCFFNYLIQNKFGSDLNASWPSSTCTDRVDRWSTPVIFTVRVRSDLSDSLSKCTVAMGDNGASDYSWVECCYLYANEVGSNNFICIKKNQPTPNLSFRNLSYLICEMFISPHVFVIIWHTVKGGSWQGNSDSL